MSSAAKMRVAMVGVGGFGGYRRERMRETGLFEIVAAYDLNPQALADAEKLDGARPVGSYAELLDTPGIEAMVISTGGKFHAEQALQAMERGLHVFVEKPLCSTPEETRALLEMQAKTGVVAGMGHNDHANSATCKFIKSLMASGEMGNIATFEQIVAHSGGLEIRPGDWRGDPEKNPGGMLFQCGVHALHELMFLFGPVKRVTSMMRYDVHTTQTADVALCILEFASGLIGTLNAYHVTPYRHTLNIYGTKKSLYLDSRAPSYGDPAYNVIQERKNCQPEFHIPLEMPKGNDICGNLKSFYTAVREGGEPYPSLKDGARAVMVVFAAEESAKTGKTVEVCTEVVPV
ncbi:MAG: Gfo/Idh/MocA family protein [Armatimonadota bacterium]